MVTQLMPMYGGVWGGGVFESSGRQSMIKNEKLFSDHCLCFLLLLMASEGMSG